MRTLFFLAIMGLSSFSFATLSADNQSSLQMEELYLEQLADRVNSSIYPQYLPQGFSASLVEGSMFFPQELRDYLAGLESESFKDWQNYVDQSGEYDHLSVEEREFARNNPADFMRVEFLNDIEAIYSVYKDGQFIGYAVDITRHVRQTIIQDGSGLVIFLNRNLEMVIAADWDA